MLCLKGIGEKWEVGFTEEEQGGIIRKGEGSRRDKQRLGCLESHRKAIVTYLSMNLRSREPHLTGFGRTDQAYSMSTEAFCHDCAFTFYP